MEPIGLIVRGCFPVQFCWVDINQGELDRVIWNLFYSLDASVTICTMDSCSLEEEN